ncbi:MAG: hypothetical protein U0T84_01515 [Chitinophagales bacterium]
MKYSVFCLLILLSVVGRSANPKADSLWCDALHQMIKAASLDIVLVELKQVNDSADVAPFIPKLQLSPLHADTVCKRYGKVSYRGLMFPPSSKDRAELYWYDLAKKVRTCLEVWQEQPVPQNDGAVEKDILFTNTEDETVVRLQLLKQGAYRVLMQVY